MEGKGYRLGPDVVVDQGAGEVEESELDNPKS
jgi:hypothetical protein